MNHYSSATAFYRHDAPLHLTHADLRREIVGIDTRVPTLDGTDVPYVFLDNGASTPAFRSVMRCVEEFLPWYSGVHRGTGFKSLLATEAYDAAHDVVGLFVGADLEHDSVVFARNTTECVNKLANRLLLDPGDLVVTTMMEHHSNDLPWRQHPNLIHLGVTAEGHLDLAALKRILRTNAGRVKLVAISGASNITGICQPIHDIAAWAHAAGAMLFVDAAQLAPHRRIHMLSPDDPGHIDFVALSAHKMYAPFGTGALIGPKSFFAASPPDMVGGGVVEVVTVDHVVWNQPPHKEEAGSPNVIGGIALAAAIGVLQAAGMDKVAAHETELLTYAYRRLKSLKGVELYGPTDDMKNKVGTITFNVVGKHHALVAAILGLEGGIGVRNGCFCAHPYVKHLLRVSPEEDRRYTEEVLAGNKSNMPGMVRASLGCYNNEEDIDALVEMLGRIVRGEYKGRYVQDPRSGAFFVEGHSFDFAAFFPYFAPGVSGRRPFSEAS
jgi:cysteine desulfurase / selenocysteine lyase